MRIIGNMDLNHALKFGLIDEQDALKLSRVPNTVGPHLEIAMTPSGVTQVTFPGRKCEHGAYIPSNSLDPDRAEYCSSCYEFLIQVPREEKSDAG